MAFRATQEFILGLTTLTLPAPKKGSIASNPRKVQNAVRAADGTLFVDDKAVTIYEVEFTVEFLSRTNAVSLNTFYQDDAAGSVNTFTWVDHEYHSWGGCRFGEGWSPQLQKNGAGRWDCQVKLLTTMAFGV